MKLTHLFWSLLILVALIFIPGLFYRTHTKGAGGFELFGYYLLIWLITTIISPILLILQGTHVIKKALPFSFSILAILNLYFGAYGIYIINKGLVNRPGPFASPLFTLNLIWFAIIATYLMRRSKSPDHKA